MCVHGPWISLVPLIVLHSAAPQLPALIERAGEEAAWRFLEFFTVNIRNKNTRAAYGQAAAAFLRWCEARGITCIEDVRPVHVVGLRDRALIGVMVYAFARVSAVVSLKVEDYFPLQKRWWLRLKEKGGKVNEMGCHHKLQQYLDEYIATAGIAEDKKGPLFRAAIGRTGKLSERSMSRVDAWYMVRRRARDAGIDTAIGNHSFRAIGITDYLERGGEINIAKRMAGHSNVKTTELYDRRGDEVSFS